MLKTLEDFKDSVWVYIVLVVVVGICVIVLILNAVGCLGACSLSYSLLSGFTLFMLISLIILITLACLVLVGSPVAVSDSLVAGLVRQYQEQEFGLLRLLVDSVQRELSCCGWTGAQDWTGF